MSSIRSRVAPLLCAVVLTSVPLSAATQKTTAATQEGTLVGFADVASGANCQGTVYAANCQDRTERHYTVRVADQQLVLVHVLSKADRRHMIGVGIWKLPPNQESVLAHQLPGAKFKMWSDSDGVHIQIADKESLFQIVGAGVTSQQ